MIDNILDTSLLAILLAYILRVVSGDEPPDWWKITVLLFGGVAILIAMATALIKIWAN